MKKRKKRSPYQKAKDELDRVFSEYIRQRDLGICISCGIRKDWKDQQNGHYISRSHMNTRFDEQNCNCQCASCNVFKKGNYPAYTVALQRLYGYEIVEELQKRSREIKKFTTQELQNLIKLYKEKINHLA